MLTPVQNEVVNHLLCIFPNHTKDVIERTVIHLDNLKDALDQGQLLQRSIDLLLDRNVAEFVDSSGDSSFEQDVSGEEIVVTRTEGPKDYFIVENTGPSASVGKSTSPDKVISNSLLDPIDVTGNNITDKQPSNEAKEAQSAPSRNQERAKQLSMQSLFDRNIAQNETIVKDIGIVNLSRSDVSLNDDEHLNNEDNVDEVSSEYTVSSGTSTQSLSRSSSQSPWTVEELSEVIPAAKTLNENMMNSKKSEKSVGFATTKPATVNDFKPLNLSSDIKPKELDDDLPEILPPIGYENSFAVTKLAAVNDFKGVKVFSDIKPKDLDDDLPEILPPSHKTSVLTTKTSDLNNSSFSYLAPKEAVYRNLNNNIKETIASTMEKTCPVSNKRENIFIPQNLVTNNPMSANLTVNVNAAVVNTTPKAIKTNISGTMEKKPAISVGIDYSLFKSQNHRAENKVEHLKSSTPYKVDLTKKTLAKREATAAQNSPHAWGPAAQNSPHAWGPAAQNSLHAWGPAAQNSPHAWGPAAQNSPHAWGPVKDLNAQPRSHIHGNLPTALHDAKLQSMMSLKQKLDALDDEINLKLNKSLPKQPLVSSVGMKVNIIEKKSASVPNMTSVGQMGIPLVAGDHANPAPNTGFPLRHAPSATATSSVLSQGTSVNKYEPPAQKNKSDGIHMHPMNIPVIGQQMHHGIYEPAKIEVARSNSFGDAFTRKSIIRVSRGLDPDQARHYVGPDMGLNCLQRISSSDKKVTTSKDRIFRTGANESMALPQRQNSTVFPRLEPAIPKTREPAIPKTATVTIQSQHVITYSDPVAKPPTVVIPGPELTVEMENARNIRVPPQAAAQATAAAERLDPEADVIIGEMKTAEERKLEVVNEVLSLFPDVQWEYLNDLAVQHTGVYAVNNICNVLLETSYPKMVSEAKATVSVKAAPQYSSVDFYTDYKSVDVPFAQREEYRNQTISLLSNDFRWVPVAAFRKVLNWYSGYYAPTHKALRNVWCDFVKAQPEADGSESQLRYCGKEIKTKVEAGTETKDLKIVLLKNRRPAQPSGFPRLNSFLQQELDFIMKRESELNKEADHQVALGINEQEYEETGQMIECGCCFGEYPFESMIQCYDGHLFCQSCLHQYAKESVFGHGKMNLTCMTDGCETTFPKSQLVRALPSNILDKYEDRLQEESLNLADIGDLVRCPHCDFAAIMDPGDKVFRCQAVSCQRETCRYCKEDWREHFGKKCEELEKKDETKLRLEYEEKMTQAKVRTCHKCKAQFTKEDGCNKMTCRCGAKMCYICRKPDIDYNHFCRHARDPGKNCTTCVACSLWTNADEDDNRAVAEIQKAAEEARKEKGFTEEKLIGAPSEPPTKKLKTK